MIKVIVQKERLDGSIQQLAEVRITRMDTEPDGLHAGYVAEIAVNRCSEVGFHSRTVTRFPRTRTNVLGLLFAALSKLDKDALTLKDTTTVEDLDSDVEFQFAIESAISPPRRL